LISVKDISLLDHLKTTSELNGGAHLFWSEFCEQIQHFLGAERFFVFVRREEKLSRVAGSPESVADEHWLTLTRSALQHSKPILHKSHGLRVAQKVLIPGEETELVLVAGWLDSKIELENERLFKFRIGAQLPEQYQRNRALSQVKTDVSRLAQVLELASKLQHKAHFSEAALESCNFLSATMNSQVAIGWLEQDQVVLAALNHQPQLVTGSTFSSQLEQVMTESFAFEEEICLHRQDSDNEKAEYPEHQKFLQQKPLSATVLSMPVQLKDNTVGVIFLERDSTAFQESELWLLRLFAEHISYPLNSLYLNTGTLRDRWKRVKSIVAGKIRGKKTSRDLVIFGSAILMLLAVLLFPLKYRVDANFILQTDSLKVVTAPFDGYLALSNLRSGDEVSEGQIVAELDIRELLLEQAEALADLQRLQRESKKARASSALADMQIALAQVEQAQSHLQKIRYRIEGSQIKSPFNSILVEGDLAQLSGSPIRQGEVLLKLASLSDFYLELEANERVIQDLSIGMTADIRFVTRPDDIFQVTLEKIIPVARHKEGANSFRIRASFNDSVPDWWRPGMSGLAKVDAGERSIFWLLFHNLIDSFYMKFWW